jgi:hypothetical protein
MSARVARGPFVLLGLMTVATFGGPVAFGWVLRGGPSPVWPPDRLIEWLTLAGISTLVVGLMVVAIALSVANQRAVARLRTGGTQEEPGRPA